MPRPGTARGRRLHGLPLEPTVRARLVAGLCLALACATVSAPVHATDEPQVPAGALLLIGGGSPLDAGLFARFIALAGGPTAPIVVIPTAGGAQVYDESFRGYQQLQQAGATRLRLLHTLDQRIADSEAFIAPLREARGVFIFGGTNAVLAEAYVGTRTARELAAVVARGGVVAGTSAGAEIQGAFMPRGQTGDENGAVLIGDHTTGFGLLPGTAVDAHVLVLNRHFDMLEILQRDPRLLGIGLDEHTGIVVQGDVFEVIGRSYVVISDAGRQIPPAGRFYFLRPGDRFNLRTREPSRPSAPTPPFSRLERVPTPRPHPPGGRQ